MEVYRLIDTYMEEKIYVVEKCFFKNDALINLAQKEFALLCDYATILNFKIVERCYDDNLGETYKELDDSHLKR